MKIYITNQVDNMASRPKKAIGALYLFADKASVEEHVGPGAEIYETDLLSDRRSRQLLSEMAMRLITTTRVVEMESKEDAEKPAVC